MKFQKFVKNIKVTASMTAVFFIFQSILPLPSLFAAHENLLTAPAFLPETSLKDSESVPAPNQSNANHIQEPTSSFLNSSPLQAAEGEAPSGISPLPASDNSAITKLPKTYDNVRPELQSVVSYNPSDPDPALQDWSNLQVKQNSTTSVHLDFNLYNTFSYAEIFSHYDDAATQGVESINLLSLFPSGLVIGLDNGGSTVNHAVIGVTDNTGATSWVTLEGITSQSQRWKIQNSNFTGVDLTKITTVILAVEGRQVGGALNVNWGDFNYTPEVQNTPQTPTTPSLLPKLSNGQLPELKSYVSYNPNDPDPVLRDWSNANLVAYGNDFSQLNVNLYNTFSQAAAYFDYDNPLTANIESVNFNTAFAQGVVLGLDHNGLGGTIQEAFFGIMDANGITDYVKLTGIDSTRKYFQIDLSAFDEADLTQITSYGLFIEGRHVDGRLNINWGNFQYIKNFTPAAEAYDESKISTISASPGIQASGTSDSGGVGQISLTVLNSEEFEYQYYLWNSETASAKIEITHGSFDQNGIFQGNAITLPSDFTLAIRGSEQGHTKVLITDIWHEQVSFDLDLDSVYQNYTLHLNGPGMPLFDEDHVASIQFIQDHNASAQAWSDVIKVQLKGVDLQKGYIPAEQLAVKTQVIQDGLNYFELGKGVDPVTHLPYDRSRADGTVDPTHKITQPTLSGFYLQLLGDFIRGKMAWDSHTVDQALTEIDTVLNSLNQIQTQYGWNGLIPWIDQGTPYDVVGIGDNAALAQSIAVMIGSLEMANLTPAQRTTANAITTKAEAFIDRQLPGYQAAIDQPTGLFAGAVYRATGVSAYMIDRLLTEFRGAIAFLLVRFPNLPKSVWNNLVVKKDSDYVAQDGTQITNIQSFEGGAFQYFWPLLRNNERDFVGFRNALTNYFATQTDYANRNNIPGFLSASDIPGGLYAGLVGIPQIAETQEPLIVDLGSTYSLASAFSVNQYLVLDWLKEIMARQPNLYGSYGFLDSARSNSEVAQFYLGIDVASMILALNNAGPEAFEAYLQKRNQEHAYNQLYDQASQFGLGLTTAQPAKAPEFPDRSLSVFSHIALDGTLGGFNYIPSTSAGVRFFYNGLSTSFDGRYWDLNQTYDAQANQLVINYSVKNSPGKIRIELKDNTPQENLVYQTTVDLAPDNSPNQKLVIQLPNNTTLSNVKKVFMMIDSSTGDTQGDFFVHSINFQHMATSQNLIPAGTEMPQGSGFADPDGVQIISSRTSSSIEIISPKTYRLHYDIPLAGDYGAISLYSDPMGTGKVFDLTQKNKVIFGLNSASAKSVKIEIDDTSGHRAILYATGIDVTRRYYEFLTSSLQGSVDMKNVKRITFVVDQNLDDSGNLSGVFDLEIQ